VHAGFRLYRCCFMFVSTALIHLLPARVYVMFVFMAALLNKAGHYIFAPWFLSIFLSFFPCLISAAADWMPTILLHMVWP